MVAAVLCLLPWVVLPVQVLRHQHLDIGAISLAVALSLGLPALYLTVVGYVQAGRSAPGSELTLAGVADELAEAVSKQWTDEAANRRLNYPELLPVSWGPADASLTDPWDSLVRLASGGMGWPAPPHPKTWAAGPDDLAGKGQELVNVLARVPTGRLVVLGEPGAGKSVLMVRLVLGLLESRVAGGPVPFLASVASWNPAEQDLRDWLSAQLLIDHPDLLAHRPPAGRTEHTRAVALLDEKLILPVLDGLDEIPDKVRGPAIGRINAALRPGVRLVVTCRSEQYRDAIRPKGGPELKPVEAAAAIELSPLDLAVVRDYLKSDAPGPDTRARWDRVFRQLGKRAPARAALATPLMVGLARAIYNSSPSGQSTPQPDPIELRSRALADRKAVESLLFDAFIPAVYRNDADGRWKAQDAEKWLEFLARHLEYTIGNPNFAWWQLPQALSIFRGIAGAATFARKIRLQTGWDKRERPPSIAEPATRAAKIRLLMLYEQPDRKYLSYLSRGVPAAVSSAPSPAASLKRDRKLAIRFGLTNGTPAAALAGLVIGSLYGIIAGVVAGVALWTLYLFGAVGIDTYHLAWPWYRTARIWLALRRRLPWSLMDFLDDAHKREILRQEGAVYQFRHIDLQHRLATRGEGESWSALTRPRPERLREHDD